MPDAYATCLYASADALRQRAHAATRATRSAEATDADRARALALFEALALVLQNAEAAGLTAADVGLGGFDFDLFGPIL